MPLSVRLLRPQETRTYLEIVGRAIRGLAVRHYPPHVIDAWVPSLADDDIARVTRNEDGEIRIIAELDGEPVGIGALVPANDELRACYVVPEAARCGCGRALVREIERLAREHSRTHLELVASLNAEPFYSSLGYQVVERTEIMIRAGVPMAAVKMRKNV